MVAFFRHSDVTENMIAQISRMKLAAVSLLVCCMKSYQRTSLRHVMSHHVMNSCVALICFSDCTEVSFQGGWQICDKGLCVPEDKVCDGVLDCNDWSDETSCGE